MKKIKIFKIGLIISVIILIISIISVKDIAHKQDRNLQNTNLATKNLYKAYIEEGIDPIEASIKSQDQAQAENQGDWWTSENTKSFFTTIIIIDSFIIVLLVIPVGIDLVRKIKNKKKNKNTTNNKYEDLERLQKLKENGTINEEEFEIEKKKILR